MKTNWVVKSKVVIAAGILGLGLALPGPALAQVACTLTGGGAGFAEFRVGTQNIRYELTSSTDRWSMQSYGHHATAAVICEQCTNREQSWGLLHLSDHGNSGEPDLMALFGVGDPPANAQERADRASEFVYYPLRLMGPDRLRAVSLTDDVQIGPMTGHAVAFRVIDGAELGWPMSIDGILAFSVTDGCAQLSGTVVVELGDAEQRLESLMSSLEVSRGQARVTPPRSPAGRPASPDRP